MVGDTARHLGVRPGVDIRILYNGSVSPGQEGMSVSPSPPQNLPSHRLPPNWVGRAKTSCLRWIRRIFPRSWSTGQIGLNPKHTDL
jgi:hypothetical protein